MSLRYIPGWSETVQPPNREFFQIPYDDREQREHVRTLRDWPEAGPIDIAILRFVAAFPRFTGRHDALVSWLCRRLSQPDQQHGVVGLTCMVPVVVTLDPRGRLVWPKVDPKAKTAGTDKHLSHWLYHGQAFVIVTGFDELYPGAKANARFEIDFVMNRNPRSRWFINAETFAGIPDVPTPDAHIALAGTVVHPAAIHLESLHTVKEDLLRTVARLAKIKGRFALENMDPVRKTAKVVFDHGGETGIDLSQADHDGNVFEALEAVDNLLGYYAS